MHCENNSCRRTGLLKSEVEKDADSGNILCLGCYAIKHPGWTPVQAETQQLDQVQPARMGYAVSLDSFRGFSAQVSHGDVTLELNVPQRALKQIFGLGA